MVQKSTVVILAEVGPIGDAAPQALRGLRGGWRSPRRRLRAHGPGRAGVVLHPELQNRVRLLPVAQPQTYIPSGGHAADAASMGPFSVTLLAVSATAVTAHTIPSAAQPAQPCPQPHWPRDGHLTLRC